MLPLVLVLFFVGSFSASSLDPPRRLRLEYMDSPLGVDVAVPRFGWTLFSSNRSVAQNSYRIVVSQGSSQVWDSGRVHSSQTSQVFYGGGGGNAKALEPETDYEWSVQWWDSAGNGPSAAATSSFSTGVGTWSNAQFVSGPKGSNEGGGQFRTQFDLSADKPVTRATIYLVGLGYYKLYIDGNKIGDHELGPFTTFKQRVLYSTHDVTSSFTTMDTKHCVGVMLGRGWFAQDSVHVGKPQMLFKLVLEFKGGNSKTVVSDTTNWKVAEGPIAKNGIYWGEVYDMAQANPGWATYGYDDSNWMPPVTTAFQPKHISSHAVIPPIKVHRTYSPVDMWETDPGVYVFDFGQNMAGITSLYLPDGLNTVAGQNITLLHAELIFGPHGKIQHHFKNTKELAVLVMDGSGQGITYTPYFTYMGYRYVQITGYPGVPDYDTLTAHFVHTSMEEIGDISFSDPMLDQVQHATRFAALSNNQNIPTDCPQRERRGWLGDAQLSCETNIHNFDAAAAYTYFVQTIEDAQNKEGQVPDCTPWYGHGHEPADPAWGAAFTFIPYWMWQNYNDSTVIKKHYGHLKLHMESLINETDPKHRNLLYFSLYGDWCPPPPHGCDQKSAIVSSFMYYTELRHMNLFARMLNKPKDAARWKALADEVETNFNKQFYDPNTHEYADGMLNSKQTAQAMALEGGFAAAAKVEPEILTALVGDVGAHHGHTSSGIVGIKYSLPALAKRGLIAEALQMIQVRSYPSYVYMVANGATTLWESWQGTRYHAYSSRNHIMFGSQSAWQYQYLAGIQLPPGKLAWEGITFSPGVVYDSGSHQCVNLTGVSASMMTIVGQVSASWECGGNSCPTGTNLAATPQGGMFGNCEGEEDKKKGGANLQYSVTIPVGSVADVLVPLLGFKSADVKVMEGGKTVWQNGKYVSGDAGLKGAVALSNAILFHNVGSGTYQFQMFG